MSSTSLTRFVKLNEVINACVILSQTAGPTITKVIQSGHLKTH